MKHFHLDSHDKISWDIDNTLLNGPNSEFFRNYIKANQHKEHHLVTFRDEEWAKSAYLEFAKVGLDKFHINSMNSCPQHLFYALFYPDNRNADYFDEALHWKGQIAASLGCTILVDDLEGLVIDGCNRHNVKFINALSEDFKNADACR